MSNSYVPAVPAQSPPDRAPQSKGKCRIVRNKRLNGICVVVYLLLLQWGRYTHFAREEIKNTFELDYIRGHTTGAGICRCCETCEKYKHKKRLPPKTKMAVKSNIGICVPGDFVWRVVTTSRILRNGGKSYPLFIMLLWSWVVPERFVKRKPRCSIIWKTK